LVDVGVDDDVGVDVLVLVLVLVLVVEMVEVDVDVEVDVLVLVLVLVVGGVSQLAPANPLTHVQLQSPVTPTADPPFPQGLPFLPTLQPPAVSQSAPPQPSSQLQE